MMDSEHSAPITLSARAKELKQALFVRDHTKVAELYWAIVQEDPDYLFKEPVQYELARLLEHNGHLGPAYDAYAGLLEHQPENKMYPAALRGAARTAKRLGHRKESRAYLERFLADNPRADGVEEARVMLAELETGTPDAETQRLEPEERPAAPPEASTPQPRAETEASEVPFAPRTDSGTGIETPDARANRLRDGQFALILPVRVKIRLEAVAQILESFLDISEPEAKKRLVHQKGLVLDELTFSQAAALIPLVRRSGQQLRFVSVPRHLRPYEHYEILRGEMHDKGLYLLTTTFDKRLRWSDMRLINCGRVGGESIVTVHGSSPIREYRFLGSTFDSNSIVPAADTAFHLDVTEFLDLLCRRAPEAKQSQTVQQVVRKRKQELQAFHDLEEYSDYCLWLLFTHFGEQVSLEELQLLADIESRW